MRVLLLYPTWTGTYGLFGHFARRASTWPPLNLAVLGAIAEQHGHQVTLIDGEAEQMPLEKMAQLAVTHKPDLIGLTATSPFFHINRSLAEGIKQQNSRIPIIIGGPHITIMKEQALLPCFDYACIGEGEETWPRFLNHYAEGKDISEIAGLLYRRQGEIISTGQSAAVTDLDRFPAPARHLLKMSLYRLGTLRGRLPFTTIQSMRGCPWQCIFCASEALRTTMVRVRSPKVVVDEMKSVVETFGIRHFVILDDVMTLWKHHIIEICDRLDQAGLAITFEGGTRANLVDEALIARLVRSGLIRLGFGLETIDSEMRQTMKKQVPLEHYLKANQICNDYGVEALNSVMLGLPGETKETVRKTLHFLKNAREVKQANFAIAVPYPGTVFHEMAARGEHGLQLMTNDFSEYRRYGSAVTTVNELTPADLISLQNEGFVSIYSAWWRWRPMLKKHGLFGGTLMLFRVVRMLAARLFAWPGRHRSHERDGLPRASASARGLAAPAGHYGDPRNPNLLS